jgi:preprotein translocase subunit YajC
MLNVLLQATADPAAGGGNMSMTLLMIVAMIAIFYFLMIRPQQKRQKEVQRAREAMKVGDKVVTAGGIHGRIKEVCETSMLLEVDEGVRIRVDKSSVFASSEDVATAQQK